MMGAREYLVVKFVELLGAIGPGRAPELGVLVGKEFLAEAV